ncbi:MAG: ion transporter [Campylobacterota bacterium]|nr:ion transporter [Campylobacterota bacterium]
MTFKQKIIEIREAKWFSNLTTGIILFYAAALGFKTIDQVAQPYGWLFYSIDMFITVYFLIEIIIKISAEENIKDFFKDGWNVFDFVIVVITLIPLENSSFAAIARLMRIFRVLRLLNARPELKKIIDMLIGAIPSIVDIVILMFIIFYIYAIVGNFFFESLASGLWKDFLTSMLTLFRVLTFEDWTDVMYEAMELYSWAWAYFVSFVIIAAFVFFNLFVAVIIGEMEKIQNADKDEQMDREEEKLDLLLEKVNDLQNEIKSLKENR